MRVVLLSGHYLESKRKAGFHWLATAYRDQGHDVVFATVSLSWLSALRRDHRMQYPVRAEANRLCATPSGIASYVWFTPWHPANLRSAALNALSAPLFRRYGTLPLGDLEAPLRHADLVVFESTPAIALTERVRALNPRARLVYRVSDDVRLLRMHPVVIEAEDRAIPHFDLVSVPSTFMMRHFGRFPNARVHHHGIRKDVFDAPCESPYDGRWTANAVLVGNSHFDYDFVHHAADRFPTVGFHLIGPLDRAQLPQRENVLAYGEMPFQATIPYVKHADVGLQIRAYSPGAESLSDSLKVIQYSHCRLPIVAPDFLAGTRSNVHGYRPGDAESMHAAMHAALRADRAAIPTDDIRTWDELATVLAAGAPGEAAMERARAR